jgi:hypothetical protein
VISLSKRLKLARGEGSAVIFIRWRRRIARSSALNWQIMLSLEIARHLNIQ